MKIKAYQIAPEYQESPLMLFDEWLEGLEIYGNRKYIRRTSDKYYTQGANNEAIIAEALSIVTGQKWEYKQISGCCQSEWNCIYYRPEEWTEKALEYFEIEYFNTGDEWRIEDEEGEDFGTGDTHEWNDDEKRREIAENIGVDPDEVTLYLFDGWTKTAKYKGA